MSIARLLPLLLPLLLLRVVVVARSASSFDFRKSSSFAWTTCQNGTDISILSARLAPDPVRPGGAATFVLRGALDHADRVPDSAIIDVDIRYQSVPVYRDVLKLCETVRSPDDDGSTTTGCPIERGNNGTTTFVTMEYDAVVPELAPSGEFDARFAAKRGPANDEEEDNVGDVFCVEATLRVKGPFRLDGESDYWVEENEEVVLRVS